MKSTAIFICIIVLLSCSKQDTNTPNASNSHLKYFGFAITDCGTNFTNQVDDFVNVIDMCPADLNTLESRVTTNTLHGNKVIIHLQALFINAIADVSSPSGFRYGLLDNYQDQFNTWASNNSFLSSEMVAAFDFVDEPAWNQMNMQDLALAAETIKNAFPDIPILIVEARDLINELEITDAIDWIGFDSYGTLDPQNDPEYLQRLELIKSKRTNANQKLVLIMESQWLDFYTEAGFDESILIPMANSYYNLAQSEDDVIALISYLLPSGFDTPDQRGFLDLEPETRTAIQNIGHLITN